VSAAITMRRERAIRKIIRILNYRLFDYLLSGHRFLD